MSQCDPVPTFYYLLRDQVGDVRGVIRSHQHYGPNSMLGAYRIEETNQSEVETLEAFEVVDSFDINSKMHERVTRLVSPSEWKKLEQ